MSLSTPQKKPYFQNYTNKKCWTQKLIISNEKIFNLTLQLPSHVEKHVYHFLLPPHAIEKLPFLIFLI